MDDIIKRFKIPSGNRFSLKDHDPKFALDISKKDGADILDELKKEMDFLHEEMYAWNKNALLIMFQAMDAAGKDSAIEHTMSGLNPQGCQVYSFKQPSAEELDHDFLWRHYKALPEKGRIGIHNRSHYENVLVCKVHPEYVLNERIAGIDRLEDINDVFWESRFESIRNFERHISTNGTFIIKFFLNVSKEEQKERFLDRINEPLKNWKFSSGDIDERERWDEYMHAYEDAINATSEEHAPWYVIPADKKWFARIAISKIIVKTMKEMNMQMPVLSDNERAKLDECKRRLMDEK